MTNAPRVDVILPTFRRPHTIASSIQSVLAQTHPSHTLHVIGDGCDDATEATVRSFHDPRLRFHRFPKAPGVGYANRNRVLRETDGEYVAYANDDDLWFRDHLERGIAALEADDLSLIAFRSCPVRYPDRLDPFFFAFDWRVRGLSPFLCNWFTGAATLVHRRSVFEAVGYWDERLPRFGDREFYARVRRSPLRTAYSECVTVLRFYAQHWDTRYHLLKAVPQLAFVSRLGDAAWCAAVRAAPASRHRGARTRYRQLEDFFRFGMRSGPSFLGFWIAQWRRSLDAAEASS